jgi:inosose dehydratase
MTSRRDFVAGLGAAAVGSALPLGRLADALGPARDIRLAYAAITWGGNDRQAIEDIAAVGFEGIQLRSNVLGPFGQRPAALRELLRRHRLTMVALSSGAVRIDPALEKEVVAEHVSHARFVRAVGGRYLQVTDERPAGRAAERDDYARLGRLLTEIGARTADLGVPLGYHPHVGSLGEAPDEVARILDAADARVVKLLLDVAHYQQGGGDPVQAVRSYHDRLLFLHIKDVQSPVPGAAPGAPSYRFVELGRGTVDLKGVFAALRDVRFRGWAVVELDSVPAPGRTPKESALISKRYLEEQIGLRVS